MNKSLLYVRAYFVDPDEEFIRQTCITRVELVLAPFYIDTLIVTGPESQSTLHPLVATVNTQLTD